jgi:hypothetical protein
VTEVSGPAGSGKTYLLRSWISEAGIAVSAAWVSVQRDEREPQRFWRSVLDALRGTRAGSTGVRAVTPAPDPDTWAIVEGMLEDRASLDDRDVPARGDRPRCARRRKRGRACPRARARSQRGRGRAPAVPPPSRTGAARAPSPASYRPRFSDLRDPQPAGRTRAGFTRERHQAVARAAHRKRDTYPALPAHKPLGARDRRRALPVREHRQIPHPPPLRQARRAPAQGGG